MGSHETIDQLVSDWLADQSSSQNTVRQYRHTVRYWFRFLSMNRVPVDRPVRSNVISYRNHLQSMKKSPFTINNYLASVRSFYAWMEANGKGENIAAGIRVKVRYKDHRRGHLSEDQIQKLFSFDQSTLEGLRDYLIIAFMLIFALRRSEVWGILDEDIQFKPETGDWVLYVKRKGHFEKAPISNIPPNILEVIRSYQAARGNGCPQLFQDHRHKEVLSLSVKTISQIINRRLTNAGLKSKTITAHSLRHTAAVRAIRKGASLYEVQKMLGHTSPDTTRPYFLSMEDEKYMSNPVIFDADKSLPKPSRNAKKEHSEGHLKGYAGLNMNFNPRLQGIKRRGFLEPTGAIYTDKNEESEKSLLTGFQHPAEGGGGGGS